jgi:hypothetical protein
MTTPTPPHLLEGIRIIDLTWILVGELGMDTETFARLRVSKVF